MASIATLAAAIGAAAVTWSALSTVLLRPLPVADPDTLYVVANQFPGRPAPLISTGLLYPEFQQIRESGVFSQTVAHWRSHLLLVSTGAVPLRTDVAFVTHDFFDVLGVPTVVGREFVSEDDRRGATPVAVLTHRYWRQTFNSDPTVLGRTITIAGHPVPIVGVLARGFRGTTLNEKPDIYLAFHTLPQVGGAETNYFAEPQHPTSPTSGTGVMGRLAPGVSPVEAANRIAALDPSKRAERVLVMPANAAAIPAAVRPGMERFATLLAATVALLLIIGCTTVGMLLLIRTEARRAEFSMCLALGASRARLARGVAIEGALLAAGGAALALPVAWWLFRLIQVFQLPGRISIELLELSLDKTVLAACIGAALAAVVVISLIAAAFGFRADVSHALRAQSRSTPSLQQRVVRAGLVGGQIAVAVTLVAGAGLLTRSLASALSLNPGIDMSRIVTGTIEVGSLGYSRERAAEFFEAFRARLAGNPAISVLALNTNEGGMSSSGNLKIDGIPRQFPATVWYLAIDDQYFNAMGLRVTEGRNFSSDDRRGGAPAAIVSTSFARQLGDAGPALGRSVTGMRGSDAPLRIVGVASDLIVNITVLEPPIIYLPLSQVTPLPIRNLTVVATSDADDARRAIHAALKELNPQLAPITLPTLEDRIAEQMAPQRLGVTVLGALGAIAVLLTLLGTYILAESMASARMKEMGIRAALGATRRQLGSIILTDTARLTLIGVLGGLALAWMGTTTIRSFLFQVEPFDPLTIGSVAAAMFVLALAVSLRAALRVARVDLAHVLRNE